MASPENILETTGLTVRFRVRQRGMSFGRRATLTAVNDVSLSVAKSETLGVVGESGSGKSTLVRAALALVPFQEGEVRLAGKVIHPGRQKTPLSLRRSAQIVFQDPYSSLNPYMSVAELLSEPLIVHGLGSKAEQAVRIAELLQTVGLDPTWAARRYPFELSGGQRQRVGIARALAVAPELVVCDEAVSALDVSVRAQIMNLLVELRERLNLSYVFVSHDLSVIREIAHRVAVMYLGRIVELGTVDEIFNAPKHPYTLSLLSAVPVPDPKVERNRRRILLQGDPPSPLNPPSGCAFRLRCPFARPRCAEETPALAPVGGGQSVACHFWREVDANAWETRGTDDVRNPEPVGA